MKAALALAVLLAALGAGSAIAQQSTAPGLGEVVVTANRGNARYAQQERPVIGLRRQADAVVMPFSINSDTREEPARKKEIHTVLLAMIDRAAAAGIELVSGTVQLEPVTRTNYQDLALQWGGRVDTGKVDLMIKTRLDGTPKAAQERLMAFLTSTKKSGRATIDTSGGLTLTVVNPDQYRDAIVKLVADDARHNAAIFGGDFTFNVTGIDGQIGWSQVSSTEVFLYLPYRYNIVPK
jgi:hypothetical protein